MRKTLNELESSRKSTQDKVDQIKKPLNEYFLSIGQDKARALKFNYDAIKNLISIDLLLFPIASITLIIKHYINIKKINNLDELKKLNELNDAVSKL